MSKQVITLSDRAAIRVKEIMAKAEEPIVGVRVGVASGGCAGMSYVMEYAKTTNPNDEVIVDKGVSGNDLVQYFYFSNNFFDANLQNVNFSNTDLTFAVFREANLTNANLSNSVLTESSFLEADLNGVILDGAILNSVNLKCKNHPACTN